MHKVRLAYLGLLKSVVGRSEEELEIPDHLPLGKLLDILAERHGEAFRARIFSQNGQLQPYVNIYVNGESVGREGGFAQEIKGDAEVSVIAFISPIEGGAAKGHPIAEELKGCGIEFVVYLPDVWTTPLYQVIAADPFFHLIRVAREEEGVAICAGLHMGGKGSALLIQNAGMCACVNSLNLLAMECRMPFLLLVSYRGSLPEREENQIAKGRVTRGILETLGIPYHLVEKPEDVKKIGQAFSFAQAWSRPVALLLGKEALFS